MTKLEQLQLKAKKQVALVELQVMVEAELGELAVKQAELKQKFLPSLHLLALQKVEAWANNI